MRRFAASARSAFRSVALILVVGLVFGASVVHVQPAWAQEAPPFAEGEVFVGLGLGKIGRYSPDGTLIATLDKGPDVVSDAGMDFDAAGNLYAANYQSTIGVSKFDNTGTLIGPFGSGYTLPESIVVDDAGNVYVGQDDGDLLKFDPSGALIASFTPESPGNDQSWIDLAPDQCTLYYTGGAPVVKRFDVCTGTQLPDLVTLPDGFTHNVRVRPNGDVLVAQSGKVYRVDPEGFVNARYTMPGSTLNLGLDLDPDGRSFWTTDWYTGVTVKFDMVEGAIVTSFVAAPDQDFGRFGLAVFGDVRTTTGSISGAAYVDAPLPANVLEGAQVIACGVGGSLAEGFCSNRQQTDPLGRYLIAGLPPGEYEVRLDAPTSRALLPPSRFTVTVEAGHPTSAPDALFLTAALPPSTVEFTSGVSRFASGIPVLRPGGPHSLEYRGCVGADPARSFAVLTLPDGFLVFGEIFPLAYFPLPGLQSYLIVFPRWPASEETLGAGHVTVGLDCPGGGQVVTQFDVLIYTDPSGTVLSTMGGPIADASVVLLRADTPDGPFDVVPDGSIVMSPSNRTNPDATGSDGRFGWDVIDGYYTVRAARAGCFLPGNPAQAFVETEVLTIPPPVTGLGLVLECEDTTAPGTTASATAGGSPYTFGSWTNDSVVLTLDASDEGGSGVSSTLFAIDRAGCAPATPDGCFTYAGPFEIAAEGAHTVTFFSRDAHGNVEPAQTLGIRIDRTAPAVVFRYDPGTRRIAVDGRDTLSGAAELTTIILGRQGGAQRLQTLASDLAGNLVTVDWRSLRNGLDVRVERIDGAAAVTNGLGAQPVSRRLKQHAELGGGPDKITLDASYNGAGTEIIRREGAVKTLETRPGLTLLSLVASATGLAIEY